MNISHLRCEYLQQPLGIDVVKPRFCWQFESSRRNVSQAAYQVLVASQAELLSDGQADLWNSGKVASDQSLHVPYEGIALSSRQRVCWRVTIWDDQDETSSSEASWFEMGLLDSSEWQASWITTALTGGPRSSMPVPHLRRSFSVDRPFKQARLYVTALGVYDCSLNGQQVAEDVFAPGWTDYHKRLRYQVYDVSDLLSVGDNVLGALLGDGWAAGFVGISNRQRYVDKASFLAQLEISYEDGTKQTIISDEQWKHQYGALLESDMLMGEAYDARLELEGWNQPGYDDSDWLAVARSAQPLDTLVATNGPMIRRMAELSGSAPIKTEQNIFGKRDIVDLGQNMVGWVRFKGSAPRGTTVVLRYAEVLDDDGELYTDNLRSATATDVYTFKGDGVEVWEPQFTFHGFRYVEIRDYPAEVTADTITGIVLYSDMAETGHFECSEPLLNQLQRNIVWGQRGNFLDVPTDCPQRDERLGWTGDIQVFARTAAFNMDVAAFMTKWADDVRDAQDDRGAVPAVVPNASITLADGGPAWADAAIICPWTIYQCYGDRRILEENYDVMTKFMDFLLAESPGFIRCAPDYQGWRGFGDWLSINADTPRDLIGTAFLAYDAKLMAEIARILGKTADVARYESLFQEVKAAFQQRFLKGGALSAGEATAIKEQRDILNADTISRGNLEARDYGPVHTEVFNSDLFTPTQTSFVLALQFELLPDNLRASAISELVADIQRRDKHLSTGFVGAPYLAHALSDNGELELAYTLLLQQSWPSWLYSVTQGGTTIWERWDGWTEERGFQSAEMNSFNHYAYGSIGAWMVRVIAGLDIGQAGYKHAVIQPQPGGNLSHAEASLKTLYGKLSSAWKVVGNHLELAVSIPVNTTASVYLPLARLEKVLESAKTLTDRNITHVQQENSCVRLELGSGDYVFSYQVNA